MWGVQIGMRFEEIISMNTEMRKRPFAYLPLVVRTV
jgi:hypothetical protein